MAKKKTNQAGADTETKREWLAKNRKKFSKAGEAMEGLKSVRSMNGIWTSPQML